jgi:hypothetical protein
MFNNMSLEERVPPDHRCALFAESRAGINFRGERRTNATHNDH